MNTFKSFSRIPFFFFSSYAKQLKDLQKAVDSLNITQTNNCEALQFTRKEIAEVFHKNIENFKNTLKIGDNPRYIGFLMEVVLEANYENVEFFNLVADRLINLNLKDPVILHNIYNKISFYKRETSLMKDLIDYTQNQIIITLPFYNSFQRFNFSNKTMIHDKLKSPKFTKSLREFENLTKKEKKNLYLKELGLEFLTESSNHDIYLEEIHLEKNIFTLKNKKTSQELILLGSHPYPNQSFLNGIEIARSGIDLLILEDRPFQEVETKELEKGNSSAKNALKYIKDIEYKNLMEGQDLEIYLKTFINNEIFALSTKQEIVFQKINSEMYIPSELGSISLNYVLNTKNKSPKIYLADYPVFYKIFEMLQQCNLKNLQEFAFLTSLITLAEKYRFSSQLSNHGCPKCGIPSEIPRDHFSIIAGDPIYSVDRKLSYFCDQIFSAMEQNPSHSKILVFHNSMNTRKLLQEIGKKVLNYHTGLTLAKTKEEISAFLSKTKNNDELLEKSAILEVIHQTFDTAMIPNLPKDQKTVELAKYIDFVTKYEDTQTYEALGGPPYDPSISPTSEECKANLMIFGTNEGFIETLRSEKFWLNPEFQRIFSASEEEIEKLKQIYSEIRIKTCGESSTSKRKTLMEKKIELKEKIGRIKEKKMKKNVQNEKNEN